MSERCPKCEADFYCTVTDSDSHCDYWHCRSVRRIVNGGSSHFTQTDRCQVRCLTATLAACESELAEAQRRVAELEDMHRKIVDGIEWTMTNIADDMRCATPETDPWCKSLKRVHDLLVAVRKALLPPYSASPTSPVRRATMAKCTETRTCPIGLDNSPEICSAGTCDVCVSNRLKGLSEELAAASAEIERLRSLLAEAHEAVANWGAYAGDYFQEKWGWRQDVEKFAPFAQYNPKDHPHA